MVNIIKLTKQFFLIAIVLLLTALGIIFLYAHDATEVVWTINLIDIIIRTIGIIFLAIVYTIIKIIWTSRRNNY